MKTQARLVYNKLRDMFLNRQEPIATITDTAVGSIIHPEPESKPRKWMFWRKPKVPPVVQKIFYAKDPKMVSGDAERMMQSSLANLQNAARLIVGAMDGTIKYDPAMYIRLLQELKNARQVMKQFGNQMKETDLYRKLDHDTAFVTIALKRLRSKLKEEGFEKVLKTSLAKSNSKEAWYSKLINDLKHLSLKISLINQGRPSDPNTLKEVVKVKEKIPEIVANLLPTLISSVEGDASNQKEFVDVACRVLSNVDKFARAYERGKWSQSDNEGIDKLSKVLGIVAKPIAGKMAGSLARGFKPAAKSAGRMFASGAKRLLAGKGGVARRLDVGAAHLARATRKPAQAAIVAGKKKLGRGGRKWVGRLAPWVRDIGGYGVAEHYLGGNNEGANKSIKCKDLYKGLKLLEKDVVRKIYGGKARSKNITEEKVDPQQLRMGIEIEMEHTSNRFKSKQIALVHLAEISNYYTLLHEMERDTKKKNKKNDLF